MTSFNDNYKYHSYLANLKIFNKFKLDALTADSEPLFKGNNDTESYYNKPEHFEEMLLFYSLIISKFYSGPDIDKKLNYLSLNEINDTENNQQPLYQRVKSLPFINIIFELAEISSNAFNMPIYVRMLQPGEFLSQ